MSVSCPPIPVSNIGKILNDVELPLKDRFRALFTLRNIGGHESIDLISKSFNDKSALLKHELAYCLGQMQDDYAVQILLGVLADKTQEPMVRHEAGEALGAIGCPDVLDQLAAYTQDDTVEVAETCELAMARIKWLQNSERDSEVISENPYKSVDPAPASGDVDIPRLRATLLDESLPLFERYRAIFSLRNIGTAESVIALAEGLKCRSALFRHEIAYVLGQIQHAACVARLTENLRDVTENPMVRHECAEALGSIATTECMATLDEYLHDTEQVVRDSCIVALDMCEYEQSGVFQYADTMARLKEGENLLPHAS